MHVKLAIAPLDGTYTYKVSEEQASLVKVGCVLNVEFARRKAIGFVLEVIKDFDETNLKYKISEVSKENSFDKIFTPELIDLCKWIANYYVVPLSQVFFTILPKALNPIFDKSILLREKNVDTETLKGKTQKDIINYLKKENREVSLKELNRKFKSAHSSLKSLEEKEIVEIVKVIQNLTYIDNENAPEWTLKEVTLNSEQEKATKEINNCIENDIFKSYLLYGVTGSGKTEVYIEAMQTALKKGKDVLLVVPEIALTPQLIDRLRARLGSNVAVLHSAVSKRARWDAWCALINGTCKVAIGARSAIFAPLKNIGLIIVDEEHDSSYKQSDGLRYNARDLAIVRGSKNNCPVVLGSATPSLESFANTIKKRYQLLELRNKHTIAEKQEIEIVNLNLIKPWEMPTPLISAKLYETIGKSINRQEQCFILYNRRGFATYFQCQRCKDVLSCKQCDVSLTYHQNNNKLLCHYCGINITPPKKCDACHDHKDQEMLPEYILKGAGTEKVYDDLKKLFPEARISRLDKDSADSNIETRREIIDDMRANKIDILVGTQMIAKGHDLPNVTVVGIIDCDVGLHIPDFRAAEKVFQLLTQATGRAGRAGKNSKIILQTRNPKHPSLLATKNKNYLNFAKIELDNRKLHLYPPFSKLLRIVVRSTDPEKAHAVAEAIKQHAVKLIEKEKIVLNILGPTPAPINRVKNDWRWHMIVKSKELSSIHLLMRSIEILKKKVKDTHIALDIDAQDML